MIEDEHRGTYLSNFFQKGTKVIRKTSRAVKNDIIVGVCYSPLDQEEQADEAYRQIGGASHSQALVLMGNVSHHAVCCGDNMAGYRQPGRLLECIDGNFHLQIRAEPMRRGSLLDHIHQKGGALSECKDQGNLVCSDHGGVQDSEDTEEREKKAHNSCLQVSIYGSPPQNNN